jgi:hypothetical protein
MRWTISILVVSTGSSYPRSQQASDKISYEGQTVAVVDLVANPRISVDSLRPLVQQRTGEAYSGAKDRGKRIESPIHRAIGYWRPRSSLS